MKIIKVGVRGYYTKVDDEDYEWLNKYKWHIKDSHCDVVYARKLNKVGDPHSGTYASMHRMIMGITDPKIFVDHKDGNGLNNQRNNLRLATAAQNNLNKKSKKGSTSQYIGVYFHTQSSMWRAVCRKYGKMYTKHFKTERDAVGWYNEKAYELHGEFARLNIINDFSTDIVDIYPDLSDADQLLLKVWYRGTYNMNLLSKIDIEEYLRDRGFI